MTTCCTTLIVDDDPDMAFLARATIEVANAGLVVSGAVNDPEAALPLWREQHPDVVLLDYRMPRRNGLEVAGAILDEDPDQAVVLFSAYFNDDIVAAAEQLGVKECVSKERVGELPQILRKYCPRRG